MTLELNIDWYAIYPYLRACLVLISGFFLAQLSKKTIAKTFEQRLSEHTLNILKKISFFAILLLFISWTLSELGFSIAAVLGTLGVVAVAIGFAAKTTLSNIISGAFIIIESTIKIGDTVDISGSMGTILSIDLLSTKLKTLDGQLIRIPNEEIIRSKVISFSHFPTRRASFEIGISYDTDLEFVRKTLLELAEQNEYTLTEPSPAYAFQGFGDSSMNIKLMVWCKKEDFAQMKVSLNHQLKSTFDAQKVDIPFPHLKLIKDQNKTVESS